MKTKCLFLMQGVMCSFYLINVQIALCCSTELSGCCAYIGLRWLSDALGSGYLKVSGSQEYVHIMRQVTSLTRRGPAAAFTVRRRVRRASQSQRDRWAWPRTGEEKALNSYSFSLKLICIELKKLCLGRTRPEPGDDPSPGSELDRAIPP